MRNDTMVIMITVMLRLDQQKEKELVAAYSNAGNPVSQFVNCVLIFVMCLLELSSKKTLQPQDFNIKRFDVWH